MNGEKTQKISISMPTGVLAAIDQHVAEIPSETRSGWLTRLAAKELQPIGPMSSELSAAIAEVGGPAAAIEILQTVRTPTRRLRRPIRDERRAA